MTSGLCQRLYQFHSVRLLFEVCFGRPLLNANAVGNRVTLELAGMIAIPLSPMRLLLIQVSAGLAFMLDIAIERILAGRYAKF